MVNECARLFWIRRVIMWQDEVGWQSGELLIGWRVRMTDVREAG